MKDFVKHCISVEYYLTYLCLQLGVCSRTTEELAQAQQQLGAAAEQASASQAQCAHLQGDLDAARLSSFPLWTVHLLAACKP